MGGRLRFSAVLAVFAVFATALPLRAEVFELWPWKGGGAPSGGTRVGELPGKATPLYTEPIRVNGVPLEMKVSALDADFPSLLATLMLLSHQYPHQMGHLVGALLIAWGATVAILLLSGLFLRLLGDKGVNALERLMGLILIMLATQMFLDGIRAYLKL